MKKNLFHRAPGEAYSVKDGRLTLLKTWGNRSADWDARWSAESVEKTLSQFSDGHLGEYEILIRHLPRHLPVLEAGCGMGQIVMALDARGYRVEGVDYGEETIKRVRSAAPALNVRVGDVRGLDVPDGFYGGYVSLGVVEHDSDGPGVFLDEARRVLHPDGVAAISVPYLNMTRSSFLNKMLKDPGSWPEVDDQFYQYHFSEADFSTQLRAAGFNVEEVWRHAVYWGLSYDSPIIRRLVKRGFFHWRLHRKVRTLCLNATPGMRRRWAHMIMFICRPSP